MVLPDIGEAARRLVAAGFFRRGLVKGPPQEKRHDGRDTANGERNAPAPGVKLIRCQEELQHHDHQNGKQLPADQRDILERGKEATATGKRHLAHIGSGGAVLATDGKPLQKPHDQQQEWCRNANALIGRQNGDRERTEAHHRDRNQHGCASAEPVGNAAKEPAADRAHEETSRKNRSRVQQLAGLVFGGKKNCDAK